MKWLRSLGFASAVLVFVGCSDPQHEGKPLGQWMKQARNESPEIRVAAATALGKMGRQTEKAIPPLAVLVRDPDQAVRVHAIRALAEIGPAASETVPTLTALLRDDDASVRRAAAGALGRMGNDARTAVPALT